MNSIRNKKAKGILFILITISISMLSNRLYAATTTEKSALIKRLSLEAMDCVKNNIIIKNEYRMSDIIKSAVNNCRTKIETLGVIYDSEFGKNSSTKYIYEIYTPDIASVAVTYLTNSKDAQSSDKEKNTSSKNESHTSIIDQTSSCNYKPLLDRAVQEKANKEFNKLKIRLDVLGNYTIYPEITFDLRDELNTVSKDYIKNGNVNAFIQSDKKQMEACFPFYKTKMASLLKENEEFMAKVKDRFRQEAEVMNRPDNLLRSAYQNYITIKKCYEARKNYQEVYITVSDVDLSRGYVKSIESAMTSKDRIDTDRIWSDVNKLNADNISDGTTDTEVFNDNLIKCRDSYSLLKQQKDNLFPETTTVKKDF